MLRIESVTSTAAARDNDLDIFRLLLTKQQAGVLGSYLMDLAGHTSPRPRDRSMLKRLFG